MPFSQATAGTYRRATAPAHELPAPPVALPRRGRSRASVLVRACRCRQWVKNGLVVLAPAAAGALGNPGVPGRLLGVFAGFCLLSSATYLLNDVRDRNRDRSHPVKRHRPVASGELSERTAIRIAAALAAGGLVLCAAVRPVVVIAALAYLALTTSYSIWFRSIVFLDIAMVATGFLIRAAAGALAADVVLSISFVTVTFASAVLIVAGKRHAELIARGGAATRASLEHYSTALLRTILIGAGAVAVGAYAHWALTRPGLGAAAALSVAPFVLWVGRYAGLLRAGEGEAPEELILRDPGLLAFGALWLAMFVLGTHAAS